MKKSPILMFGLMMIFALGFQVISATSVFEQTDSGGQKSSASTQKIMAEAFIEDTEILVKIVAVKDNVVSGNEYVKPDAGNKLISIQIVVDNKGEDEWEVKPYNFKLKDAEGNVYETESSVSGLSEVTQPTLKSGIVDGSDLVKGWITFQVGSAVSAKFLKLRYEESGVLATKTIKSGWIALSALLK